MTAAMVVRLGSTRAPGSLGRGRWMMDAIVEARKPGRRWRCPDGVPAALRPCRGVGGGQWRRSERSTPTPGGSEGEVAGGRVSQTFLFLLVPGSAARYAKKTAPEDQTVYRDLVIILRWSRWKLCRAGRDACVRVKNQRILQVDCCVEDEVKADSRLAPAARQEFSHVGTFGQIREKPWVVPVSASTVAGKDKGHGTDAVDTNVAQHAVPINDRGICNKDMDQLAPPHGLHPLHPQRR